MNEVFKRIAGKKTKAELEKDYIELSKRIAIFEDFLVSQDNTQEFIDYIKDEIEFHEENNGEFLTKDHSWELEKQMIKEYQAELDSIASWT